VSRRRSASALLGVASLALFAAACGSSSSGGSSPNPGTSPSTGTVNTVNANGCTKPPPRPTGSLQFPSEPPLRVAPTTYIARIVTNCGTIIVSMDAKAAPHTVNSFKFLASHGYFTNSPCHRLTSVGIRVLQCGDPSGTGTGGPGYEFKDENLKGAKYPPGTVAMANSGPNTNGSQFFLVYGPTKLQSNYTPFGTITSGLDVLKRIAKAGSTPPEDGAPNQPVSIESFAVTKG
jgi:peptidyl-prolyl cis-trans isomerase B (cyclophilin B)